VDNLNTIRFTLKTTIYVNIRRRHMTITVGGLKINFREKGRGEPIIFVHGWGGNMSSLEKLHSLAAKKYRALILDLPGFGRSDRPPAHWGTKEYSRLIIELLDKLKIKKTNYFGHSFGGGLGLFISAYYPLRVNRLILAGAAFKRRPKRSIWATTLNRYQKFFPFPKKGKLFIKKILYRVFFPQSDFLRYPHLKTNFKKIIREDLTADLKKITTPTLILWGETDRYTPINQAYQLKKMVKQSYLKIFPRIGHSLPLKKPRAVFEHLDKFIHQ